MKKTKTKFKDLYLFESNTFKDSRGYFRELFLEKKTKQKIIFYVSSTSKKNVVRGLHFQEKQSQGKYLSVIKGKIFDVVVDCRKKSKTFGKYFSIKLSEKENKSLLIPEGFAHGYYTLTKDVIIHYKCSNYRNKRSETGILWNDKELKINWPTKKPIVSSKDQINLSFKDFLKR